ncbi:TPA: aminotransferase class I/II-fold pyridoxal phosphate-dependent enzyme [Clostridium perfringens]|nr:aminotransferase class I/II-fold pyridoxal phosphate-dependent enzyme [Clostridium perfringens]EJT6483997.1 aminotransferase class I/II-fold pyridoxal phosphate-dependent enzyme [Clostridium perfringens]ELC8434665.1 aminotransferase class I/II-fold pyridoxal phosphate-dependent enzyme [Clostridium perfringens]HCG3025951.1 aminotransferase class I/II-fold pyridoxal phosphate-dependent enzyme [Clostridium perfringens]
MGRLEEVFVKEAFDTNWIAPLGANVDGFEKELSEYVGSKTGAALASGTAAIHMALKALGVKKGDKVFCSSLTFAASCNPIIYEGGIPVFIDSEPESHNMSPVALEKAFKAYEEKGEMPKAVIVVNLYGQSADMDKIIEICKKYNVPIIEDAAESLGATYKGKHSGTFGEYGIYSFNGNKIITTSGGGMLVSNNKEGIAKVRFWSTQARDKARHYEHTELGYNYRMSNIVAGIGRGQLRVLEDRIAKKKEIFETYKEAFKNIEDIEMMPVCEYGEPNYWLTTITLNENSKVKPLDIILALEKENIESRPIWKPMHIQPYYKEYDFYSHNDEDKVSVSEDIFNRGVCLPSDTKMSNHDMNRVIRIIKNLFQKEMNEIGSKKEVLV